MIIWINGSFAAGKTTLSERLKAALPQSMLFDPEEIGFTVRSLVPESPTGDYQDLPIWRSMTLHGLLEVRRLYGATLIVPMTLVNPPYITEFFSGLAHKGEELLHIYLEAPKEVLRERITTQILVPQNLVRDQEIREWRMAQVDRCLAARNLMPPGTHFLNSGDCDPDALTQNVLSLMSEMPSANFATS